MSRTMFRDPALMRGMATAIVVVCCCPAVARAQLLSRYIPDYAPGLTGTPEDVQSRTQPEYQSGGVHAGAFIVRPRLLESFGYDSNVDGVTGGRSSATVDTQASVSATSDWSRNSVTAQLSVDDQRYPQRPIQDFTNWTASLGGTLDIGRDQFIGGYSHLNVVQTPRNLGAVTAVSVPFQVDSVSLGYAFATRGRFTVTPNLTVSSYHFDDVPIVGAVAAVPLAPGASLTQAWQNRVLLQGEVATRYELSPQRNALVVLRGTGIDYATTVPGVGNRNSTGGSFLVGLDYTGAGLFRYRALVGYQQRDFANGQFRSLRSPIVEASVTWTPRRTTTVTASAQREIADSTDVNYTAYAANSVQLQVAHELQRNVVLTGFGQYQQAEFANGSGLYAAALTPQTSTAQSIYSAGLNMTWLIDRNLHAGLSYQYVDRVAGAQLSYSENIGLLTLGFGL